MSRSVKEEWPEADGRPFRFMLLCHQRSGSNALGAMLNADERIALWGQLFNHFGRYRRRLRRLGVPGYRPHPEALRHFGTKPPLKPRLERRVLDLLPRAATVDEVVGRFWQVYRQDGRRYGAKGFKLHDFQLSDADLAHLATRHVDGVVMLWRSNRLKAAVSWAYAIKTDVWSRRQAAEGPPPVHRLDPDEIGWFIDKTANEVENWRRVLGQAGANVLELNYERDIETRALEPLYDFLGVPWRGRPEFRTKRLSRADYAHVANARELEERFASPDAGSLFS